MNRLTNRLVAATAGLAAGALLVTGCSSGQISQTASQESAVNGSTANVKNIALRNVHIQAVQSGDYLKPGRTVQLIFVAANDSPDINDKLVGISTDIGSVSVTGPTAIPAASSLVVGSADGQDEVDAAGQRAGDHGGGHPGPADHQRADLQLHLRLREGRRGKGRRADLGGCRASSGCRGRPRLTEARARRAGLIRGSVVPTG